MRVNDAGILLILYPGLGAPRQDLTKNICRTTEILEERDTGLVVGDVHMEKSAPTVEEDVGIGCSCMRMLKFRDEDYYVIDARLLTSSSRGGNGCRMGR